MSIREITLGADHGQIGSGGSGAHWVTAADATRWVAKATFFGGQQHKYLYLNEALTSLIAQRLGVGVPEPAALRLTAAQAEQFRQGLSDVERLVFASARIEPSEALSPEAARSADKLEVAGIIVFDTLIWNTDEKPEHVLAQPQDDGTWRLWPVDRGHALAVADSLQSLQPVDAAYQPMQLLHDCL